MPVGLILEMQAAHITSNIFQLPDSDPEMGWKGESWATRPVIYIPERVCLKA